MFGADPLKASRVLAHEYRRLRFSKDRESDRFARRNIYCKRSGAGRFADARLFVPPVQPISHRPAAPHSFSPFSDTFDTRIVFLVQLYGC